MSVCRSLGTKTVETYTVARMAVSSSVRVSMVTVSGRKHPHKIHGESNRTDDEQLPRVHLWWVEQALDSLEHDEDGDQTQEQSVGESG